MGPQETFYQSIVTTKVVPLQSIEKGASITFLSKEGGQTLRRIGKVTDIGDDCVMVNNLYKVQMEDVEKFFVSIQEAKTSDSLLHRLFSSPSAPKETFIPVAYSSYQYVKDSIRVEFKLQEIQDEIVAFVKPKRDLSEAEIRTLGQLITGYEVSAKKDFDRGIELLKFLNKNGFRITKAKKTSISEIQSTTA